MKNWICIFSLFLLGISFFTCEKPREDRSELVSHLPTYLEDTLVAKAIAEIPDVTTGYTHQAMILGAFHFHRSSDGSDVVAENHIDVSTSQSQLELEEMVQEIVANFKPTLVAVEWMPRFQPKFDSLYQAYLAGDWDLAKNEAFQIGFRVAKAMNLPTIYCVDNRPPTPESLDAIEDWDTYAESLGQTRVMNEYQEDNQAFNDYMDHMFSVLGLRQYLMLINSPEHQQRYKALSFTGLVNLGQGDSYAGADLTGNRYRRNTRIFTNVRSYCKAKSERVLIIYGGGHKWALDEIFAASLEFEVVQPFE